MCIRDRTTADRARPRVERHPRRLDGEVRRAPERLALLTHCLLYTSDAADERSSVDLGGRRIIKKKKQCNTQGRRTRKYTKQQES